MLLRKAVVLVALCLSVAACQTETSFKDVPKGTAMTQPDLQQEKPIPRADYKLHANDVIQVDVFDVPQLGRTVQVDAAGAVNLPFVGQVPAVGKTATQLADDLQTLYGEKYLKNPQITVLIRQTTADTITVDGSVNNPGVFPVNGQLTLITAIAMARGIDTYGNPRQVVVFRQVNNQRVAGLFDLSDIRAGKIPDPPIFPNDTIVVAGSATKKTVRDIVGATPLLGILPWILQ